MAPPKFVRANVRALSGCAPGDSPEARVIKLNTNENPYPPSPKVLEAIREIDAETLRRFPSAQADAFRVSAAKLWNIKPEMILAGNGGDDVLNVITRTIVPAGGSIVSPAPTYSLYSVLAQLEDAELVSVAWKKNWQLPIDALKSSKADAIFICNPNTPSGTFVPTDEIESLLKETEVPVVVDEAYADFAGESVIELVEKFEHLIVARSLSKGYSLAGLRFGYAVAQPQVIEQMMKVKQAYNCDAISIVAATAALEDQAHAQASWKNVRDERDRVSTELRRFGFEVIASRANFVLVEVPGGNAKSFHNGLKQQGVLVRFFTQEELADKLRITIGTGQENDALLGAIKSLMEKSKAA